MPNCGINGNCLMCCSPGCQSGAFRHLTELAQAALSLCLQSAPLANIEAAQSAGSSEAEQVSIFQQSLTSNFECFQSSNCCEAWPSVTSEAKGKFKTAFYYSDMPKEFDATCINKDSGGNWKDSCPQSQVLCILELPLPCLVRPVNVQGSLLRPQCEQAVEDCLDLLPCAEDDACRNLESPEMWHSV